MCELGDFERVLVRNLEFINMPNHSNLMTLDISISHTGVIRVNLEAIGLDVRAKIQVKLEGALKHPIERFIHPDIHSCPTLQIVGDEILVEDWVNHDHQLSKGAT